MSPMMATRRPSSAPRRSRMVRASSSAWVGCSWVPSPALMMGVGRWRARKCGAPGFYWGEAGNVLTPPLFKLPIPASRATVPTGYGYVLPDQNGWSRYLHFQSAWVCVLTGLLYVVFALFQGHFRQNLLPARADLSWRGARP